MSSQSRAAADPSRRRASTTCAAPPPRYRPRRAPCRRHGRHIDGMPPSARPRCLLLAWTADIGVSRARTSVVPPARCTTSTTALVDAPPRADQAATNWCRCTTPCPPPSHGGGGRPRRGHRLPGPRPGRDRSPDQDGNGQRRNRQRRKRPRGPAYHHGQVRSRIGATVEVTGTRASRRVGAGSDPVGAHARRRSAPPTARQWPGGTGGGGTAQCRQEQGEGARRQHPTPLPTGCALGAGSVVALPRAVASP